jgi:ATP-binding cassette, subfamily F, member 3
MITVNKVSVVFGGFSLFKEISFIANSGDRIGLVGRNGAGKSTLLKLLNGMMQPSDGEISRSGSSTIGYLPQEMVHAANKTVLDETATAFEEILALEKELEWLNSEIVKREDHHSAEYDKLLHRLSDASEHYNMLGGHSYMGLVEQTLTGLGFNREDFPRPVREFSIGWRMRIELAKILLRKPDLMLLDEPTNHLDIESIQWLEDYLATYQGAVILVSHDRAFLDNVTNRTIEISLGKIYDYSVSYSKFVDLSYERRANQMATYLNQQKMIQDTEKFIERFRYKASKAVQVQSRIKQLEKLDIIEVEEEDVAAMDIRFPPAERSGTIVVEAVNLNKSYGNFKVLENVGLIVERGEKVALVGKNGTGKTTMSRIIVGELQHEGLLKKGHNVRIGYYAQNQDELLSPEKTVYQVIDEIAVGDIRTRIRAILGAFLFRGEEVDKKVKVLSGGEKSRLALAKLLLEPYNLLVLDEPTNHLDMRSKDILKNALLKYDGTLILVSHDRQFLDGLVKVVYEFRDMKIKQHLGGIYDFLKRRKLQSLEELDSKAQKALNTNVNLSGKKDYHIKKEINKKLKKLENEVKRSEEKIEIMEQRIAELSQILSNPETDIENAHKYTEYGTLLEEMKALMSIWEKQQEELESYIKENGLINKIG